MKPYTSRSLVPSLAVEPHPRPTPPSPAVVRDAMSMRKCTVRSCPERDALYVHVKGFGPQKHPHGIHKELLVL